MVAGAAAAVLAAGCRDDAAGLPDAPVGDAAVSDAAPDAYAGPGTDLPIAPAYQALADHFDAERRALGAPNAALLLMLDGEIVFAHGFGDAQRGDGFPVRASTLYRVASVTKMLTATALLQDVAAGTVDLQAPLTRYVPELDLPGQPGATASITVEHLLTHEHALRDYLAVSSPVSETGVDAFLTGRIESELYQMAPAGAFFNYSNPGYYYAGLIVERNAAQSYREAMEARVFAPLGMTRTTFLPTEVLADGDYAVATAQLAQGSTPVTPSSYDNTWARAAGYAFSSTFDLAKFVTFLRDGNAAVLPDAQRLAMQAPHVSTDEVADFYSYGYGLFVEAGFYIAGAYYEPTMIWHNGSLPGFSSEVVYVPALDFAMITLGGSNGAYFGETLQFALSTYRSLPAPVPSPARFNVDRARFPRYVATYDDPYNIGRVVVSLVGQQLRISMPDLDAANIPYDPNLQPYARDSFVLGIQGTQQVLTFFADEADQPQYLRTRFAVAATTAPGRRSQPRTIDRARVVQSIVDAVEPRRPLAPPLPR